MTSGSLLLALALGAAPAAVERQVLAMGTDLTVEVSASSRERALLLAERAVREVERAEARLSTWRDDSELARLGREPRAARVAVSSELAGELAQALACWRRTGGAFNPLLGELVAAWGLRGAGRVPGDAELAAARSAANPAGLRISVAPPWVEMPGPTPFEEGAFGKGAALDAALAALAAEGDGPDDPAVRLDFGGQVAWSGATQPVVVELADPRARERPVVELTLSQPHASVSTSGDSERSVAVAGSRIGHLLDPVTGRPAADFGSVAVIASSALEADCLSTALFVMGPERGLRWVAGQEDGVEAVFLVAQTGGVRVRASAGVAGRLRALAPGVVIERVAGSS